MKYYLILNDNKIETQFAESLPLKVLQSLIGNPTESPETNLVLIEGNFGCFADNKIVLWSDADATFKKKIKKMGIKLSPVRSVDLKWASCYCRGAKTSRRFSFTDQETNTIRARKIRIFKGRGLRNI